MENDAWYRDLPWIGYLFGDPQQASVFQEFILDVPGPVYRFGSMVVCQVHRDAGYAIWGLIRQQYPNFQQCAAYEREETLAGPVEINRGRGGAIRVETHGPRGDDTPAYDMVDGKKVPATTPFQRVLQGGMDKARRAHPGLFEGEDR